MRLILKNFSKLFKKWKNMLYNSNLKNKIVHEELLNKKKKVNIKEEIEKVTVLCFRKQEFISYQMRE